MPAHSRFLQKQTSQMIISISTSFHLWVHLMCAGNRCGPNLDCVNDCVFPSDPPGGTFKTWASLGCSPDWVNWNPVHRIPGSSFLHALSQSEAQRTGRAGPCLESSFVRKDVWLTFPFARAWLIEIRLKTFGGPFFFFFNYMNYSSNRTSRGKSSCFPQLCCRREAKQEILMGLHHYRNLESFTVKNCLISH